MSWRGVLSGQGRSNILLACAWVLAVMPLVLVLARVPGDSSDPRAYPGTRGDVSLEELLAEFQLELPPCKIGGLRYYALDDLSRDLSLRFSLPENCLHEFLKSLNAYGGYTATGHVAGISTALIKKLGWPIDLDKTYEVYSARPIETSSYDIVVDRYGKQPVVYMDGINSEGRCCAWNTKRRASRIC